MPSQSDIFVSDHKDVMCLTCAARDSFLCSGLEDDELRHLAAHATRFEIPRGKHLILEGEASNNVYNIISGDLSISRLSSDGRRQILGFLGSGDFLGLTLKDSYRFSAEALTDVRLCRFDRGSLENLTERFPGMAHQVRRMGSAALDSMLDHVFSLGRKSASERVCTFLLALSHKQGNCHDPARQIRLSMSRSDIADHLGLTIETVSRTLSRLKSAGVIDIERAQTLHILDAERLEEMTEESAST